MDVILKSKTYSLMGNKEQWQVCYCCGYGDETRKTPPHKC
jgi:hypothetical protein